MAQNVIRLAARPKARLSLHAAADAALAVTFKSATTAVNSTRLFQRPITIRIRRNPSSVIRRTASGPLDVGPRNARQPKTKPRGASAVAEQTAVEREQQKTAARWKRLEDVDQQLLMSVRRGIRDIQAKTEALAADSRGVLDALTATVSGPPGVDAVYTVAGIEDKRLRIEQHMAHMIERGRPLYQKLDLHLADLQAEEYFAPKERLHRLGPPRWQSGIENRLIGLEEAEREAKLREILAELAAPIEMRRAEIEELTARMVSSRHEIEALVAKGTETTMKLRRQQLDRVATEANRLRNARYEADPSGRRISFSSMADLAENAMPDEANESELRRSPAPLISAPTFVANASSAENNGPGRRVWQPPARVSSSVGISSPAPSAEDSEQTVQRWSLLDSPALHGPEQGLGTRELDASTAKGAEPSKTELAKTVPYLKDMGMGEVYTSRRSQLIAEGHSKEAASRRAKKEAFEKLKQAQDPVPSTTHTPLNSDESHRSALAAHSPQSARKGLDSTAVSATSKANGPQEEERSCEPLVQPAFSGSTAEDTEPALYMDSDSFGLDHGSAIDEDARQGPNSTTVAASLMDFDPELSEPEADAATGDDVRLSTTATGARASSPLDANSASVAREGERQRRTSTASKRAIFRQKVLELLEFSDRAEEADTPFTAPSEPSPGRPLSRRQSADDLTAWPKPEIQHEPPKYKFRPTFSDDSPAANSPATSQSPSSDSFGLMEDPGPAAIQASTDSWLSEAPSSMQEATAGGEASTESGLSEAPGRTQKMAAGDEARDTSESSAAAPPVSSDQPQDDDDPSRTSVSTTGLWARRKPFASLRIRPTESPAARRSLLRPNKSESRQQDQTKKQTTTTTAKPKPRL